MTQQKSAIVRRTLSPRVRDLARHLASVRVRLDSERASEAAAGIVRLAPKARR